MNSRKGSAETGAADEQLWSRIDELTSENARLRESIARLRSARAEAEIVSDGADIPTLSLDSDLKIRSFTPAAERLLGVSLEDVGREPDSLDSELADGSLKEECLRVLHNPAPVTSEVHSAGGWYLRRVSPYRSSEERDEGVVIVFQEITELKRLSHRAESRERQHSVVAKLGELALSGAEPEYLIDMAVSEVARVLDADFCKVLRYEPAGESLLMIAGVGWNEGLVGSARVPDDKGSQAGYTLESRTPVIVERLSDEQRFRGPDFLIDHEVVSGISCIIEGSDSHFGVLGVHTRNYRKFTSDDANFLVSVANMLSTALQARDARETIYNSDAQFRSMANSIPQLAWMADETGNIFWYNDRWYEYTGSTPDEMEGWGWQKVLRRELVDEITEKFRSHIENGREWEDTFPLKSASGEFRWFLSRAKPIRDKKERIIRWFGTNTDVTERLEQEQALRDSEEKLHIALASNRCGYFEYEIESGDLEWDRLLKDIWGVRDDEPTTLELFYEGLHPDDRDETRRAIERSLDPDSGGRYYTVYRVINRITGEMRWIEASGQVFFKRSEPVKMIGMVTDITEKKQAEKAKDLLSSIVESSEDAIISKDLTSRINSWNKGAEKIFGYTAEEAVGRQITMIIPEDRLNEEEEILRNLKKGRKIKHFETVRRTKDGRLIDISVTISPIKDSQGRITGASKVARDITEKKRLEDSLQRAVAELQEADRKKNEFLAMLGHELRNPLSALRGSVEIIDRGFERPEELARIMQNSIDTMSKLLDDLLDLSRVSQNRITIDLKRVDLEEVLQTAAAAASGRYEDKRQNILTAISGPVFVNGDSTRLEQIFSNLLSNACRYTGEEKDIVVSAMAKEGGVVVSVRDEGIGMDGESLEKIFDPFYQVKPDGQAASGLGIGLALAKKLVELHGGSIKAFSEGLGKGSKIEVTLPALAEGAEFFSEPAREPEIELAPGLTVVLVEDNVEILTTSAILLEGLGCKVATAATAAEGLRLIRELRPDAALVDIGLPDATGYEIAETLRAEDYPNLLVAVSGYSHEEARERSREAGFNFHLAKPARTSEIAKILASAGE
ncbi:MAG TPA: PAS domain S-box protein [Aridibacter sp.]|nr:PAS domain S-box protein [Aridibacter sp.]